MNNESRTTIVSPFYVSPADADVIATGWSVKKQLIGLDVLNDRGDNVGSVSDLIVSGANNVLFAIVGVGGFLGMGKHEVAIPVKSFVTRNSELILPGATEDALKNLPKFDYPEEIWDTYDFSRNMTGIDSVNRTYIESTNGNPNLDPLTGSPGAHPIGTGVGAAGGAISGAAAGIVGGPIGVAVGAVVGSVVGGLAGKGVAEAINPTEEDQYWRVTYEREPYYSSEYTYDDYAPAYKAGYESRMNGVSDWNEARSEWARRWDAEHAQGGLTWEKAEPAVKAAWNRANLRYVQETGY